MRARSLRALLLIVVVSGSALLAALLGACSGPLHWEKRPSGDANGEVPSTGWPQDDWK